MGGFRDLAHSIAGHIPLRVAGKTLGGTGKGCERAGTGSSAGPAGHLVGTL